MTRKTKHPWSVDWVGAAAWAGAAAIVLAIGSTSIAAFCIFLPAGCAG